MAWRNGVAAKKYQAAFFFFYHRGNQYMKTGGRWK